MRIRQIFFAYDWSKSTGIEDLKFCLVCGAACNLKEKGGEMRPVCSECGFIHFINPSTGITVLIENKNKFLLVRKFNESKWNLPNSFIDYRDNFLIFACIEIKKKIGLDIWIRSIVNVTSNYLSSKAHTLMVFLGASVLGGKLIPKGNIEEIKWVSPFNLPQMAFLADAHIIERYFCEKFVGAPVDPHYSFAKVLPDCTNPDSYTHVPVKGETESAKLEVASDFQESVTSSENLSAGVQSSEKPSAVGLSPQKTVDGGGRSGTMAIASVEDVSGAGTAETYTDISDMLLPRQVFSAYDWRKTTGVENLKFCPVCSGNYKLKEKDGKIQLVCVECGFIYCRSPSPGVSILIEREGNQVLLGKRAAGNFASGKWCLPCGFIEYKDNFITAAHREVKEETGLDIKIDSIISVVSNYLSPRLHTLVVVFAAKVVDGIPIPGDDIEELKWVPATDPLPEMAFAADAHIIKRYFGKKFIGASVDQDCLLSEAIHSWSRKTRVPLPCGFFSPKKVTPVRVERKLINFIQSGKRSDALEYYLSFEKWRKKHNCLGGHKQKVSEEVMELLCLPT